MKNQKTRRVLTLLLLLVLTLQLAVVASAAQVSWVGYTGNAFIATVSKSGTTTRQTALTETRTYHTKGTATYFSGKTCAIEYNVSFGFPAMNDYAYYLKSAATKEGLSETYEVTRYLASNGVYVPSTASSGYYCAVATVYGYTATYTVQESAASGLKTHAEGNVAFAPYGVGNVMTGYIAAPLTE